MRQRLKDNNSGYSLVELVIVIAMIAVLSGGAAITISSIVTARANSAKEEFNEQIAALQARTKTQASGEAVQLIRQGDRYSIYYGTIDKSNIFVANDSSKADVILERCEIFYGGKLIKEGSANAVVIAFNKSDGTAKLGYGNFAFCKTGSKSSNEKYVGTVVINQVTGSHYIE